MGAWGTGIFQEDFTCDIRDNYIRYLAMDKSNEEATELLKTDNELDKLTDDEGVFWIALAMVQWQKGRLLDEVKDKAIYFIDNGLDLDTWEGNKKREEVLQQAKEKILSPMPEAKKIRRPWYMRSDKWKVGDLLSYKIVGEFAPKASIDLTGKYVLLRVVDMVYRKRNDKYEAVYAVYKKYGDKPLTPEMISDNDFLIFRINLPPSEYEGYFMLKEIGHLDNKEIKEHEIKVIAKAADFNHKNISVLANSRVGGSNGARGLDGDITHAFANNLTL